MKDGICRMTCSSGSLLTVKLYTNMNAMWPRNNEVLQVLEICYFGTALLLPWDQTVSGQLVDEWALCNP
jgi:hypothetical protein